MYTEELACTLSGLTKSQLRKWRTEGIFRAFDSGDGSPLYSFVDVLDMRTFAFLRSHVSLQKIREASKNLDVYGITERPSRYRFITDGKNVWVEDLDSTVWGLTERPGQGLLHTYEEILSAFKNFKGEQVVDMRTPNKVLRIDAHIRGGWPVIDKTRIGYDDVSSLIDDWTDEDDIIDFYYPDLTLEQVRGAIAFDKKVQSAA